MSDIVGEIGAHDGRQALELLRNQGVKIQLHHIAGDDLHVGIRGHGLRQHGKQGLVQFHGDHLACPLGQFRRQGADAGTNLQHTAAAVRLGGLRDPGRDLGINEKVLPHGFGKMKSVAAQQRPDGIVITKIHGYSAFPESTNSIAKKEGFENPRAIRYNEEEFKWLAGRMAMW